MVVAFAKKRSAFSWALRLVVFVATGEKRFWFRTLNYFDFGIHQTFYRFTPKFHFKSWNGTRIVFSIQNLLCVLCEIIVWCCWRGVLFVISAYSVAFSDAIASQRFTQFQLWHRIHIAAAGEQIKFHLSWLVDFFIFLIYYFFRFININSFKSLHFCH